MTVRPTNRPNQQTEIRDHWEVALPIIHIIYLGLWQARRTRWLTLKMRIIMRKMVVASPDNNLMNVKDQTFDNWNKRITVLLHVHYS